MACQTNVQRSSWRIWVSSFMSENPGYATPILYGPDYNDLYFILVQCQVM